MTPQAGGGVGGGEAKLGKGPKKIKNLHFFKIIFFFSLDVPINVLTNNFPMQLVLMIAAMLTILWLSLFLLTLERVLLLV